MLDAIALRLRHVIGEGVVLTFHLRIVPDEQRIDRRELFVAGSWRASAACSGASRIRTWYCHESVMMSFQR